MSKFKAGLILAALGLALTVSGGCAGSLTTPDGERMALRSDAFADYAERVFRLQNEVLDALAFALDARGDDDAALVAAEDRVLLSCAGLNDIAVRRQRGAGIRPVRDARTARGIPACESAAQSAADLLESVDL